MYIQSLQGINQAASEPKAVKMVIIQTRLYNGSMEVI